MGTEWVQIVSTVGFPVAACAALYYWINTTIKELTATISRNTEAINQLIYTVTGGNNNGG